jgi:aryl-alcohol dehydrogenase-like predicted oxidoreductase
MPTLALGTVQFGLDYGLTNTGGQIADREAARILQTAHDNGIVWLDTAAAYGNAEERLGSLLRDDKHFKLCSKTLPTPAGQSVLTAAQRSLDTSLTRLRRDHVDALLIHSAADLLGEEGKALWAWMNAVRTQGMAASIGISVYDADEIDLVLKRCQPDWIQLPCSVFDQRLLTSGHLVRLASQGIKLQARSLLLQGVVNLSPQELPEPLQALHGPLTRLRQQAKLRNMSSVDMAIAWAVAQQEINLAVLGVTTAAELRQCAEAFGRTVVADWSEFACDDAVVVDPRKWPPRMKPT